MRYYATFYKRRGTGYYYACGDRAVLQLDGRLSFWRLPAIAREWGSKHGFDAYTLQRANHIRELDIENNPLQNLYPVEIKP